MLFETRCAILGRWTSTPSHGLADEERNYQAPVRVMELDRVYGFDMDLRAALEQWGEVALDALCKESSVRVGGVCWMAPHSLWTRMTRWRVKPSSVLALFQGQWRLTDDIRKKKKNKYLAMEELLLLGRDFQCPSSGTVIVRGISAYARKIPQQHNRGGSNEQMHGSTSERT